MAFQAEVGAWFAAHLIARMPVGARFGLETDASPVALRLETGEGLDDIAVTLSNGGTIQVQCKTRTSLSTTADTALAKTIAQLARWVGVADASGDAPDPIKSAGVMAVRTDAPRTLDALHDGCRAFDHGGDWAATLVSRNQAQREALELFETPARTAWTSAVGSAPVDADVVALARLFRIQRFSMDEGDSDWREASQLLGRRVFGDETAGEAPLRDLKGVLRDLIGSGAPADREGLLHALRRKGHRDVGAPGFESDVARLRTLTATELARLAKHARLPLGAGTRLARDCDAPLVEAIQAHSLLVVGDPGAGKTGALVHAAEAIAAAGGTIVFLSVDQFPGVASGTDLVSEVGLGHSLIDVLAAMPGTGPKVLFVDSLDAARGGPSQVVFASLIEAVMAQLAEWTLVASIRTFDLKNGKRFRDAFKGAPPVPAHAEGALPTVRHFAIRSLSDLELSGVAAVSDDLSTLLLSASPPLRNLLKNVFNLSLAADLLAEGALAADFGRIATQSGLIDAYEDARLSRTALQQATARAASAMVSRRRLTVRKVVVDHHSLDDAIQTGVLVESGDLVQFAHHVLFDHVAGRFMLEWDDPAALVRQLQGETSTAIMLAPALRFAIERAWRADAEGHPVTWRLLVSLFETEQLDPVLGHVGLRVAAENVAEESDLRGLEHIVSASPASLGLHRLLGLLVQYVAMDMGGCTPVSARVVGWARFAGGLVATGQLELLYPAHGLVRALIDSVDLQEAAQLNAFGQASRSLLEAIWAMPSRAPALSVLPIRAVAKSFASDSVAARLLLRRILQDPHFSLYADQEAPWLAEHVATVARSDAAFAVEIYSVIYGRDITDTTSTSLGGQPSRILPLTSNRRQDYEHGRWRLGTATPELLAMSADMGTRAVIEALIANRSAQGAVPASSRYLQVGGAQVELRRGPTEIRSWRDDGTLHDDSLLKHYSQFLRSCSVTAYSASVAAALRGPTTEAVWIRIFGIGSERAHEVSDLIWPLLGTPAFLDTRKTAADAARFAAQAWATRSPAEREAFERMLLDEGRLEDSAHRERWRYVVAEFLSGVPDDALKLDDTLRLKRELAGERLLDEEQRQASAADFQVGDLDLVRRHMRRDSSDHESESDRRIYQASETLYARVGQTPKDSSSAQVAALWFAALDLVAMIDASPSLNSKLDMAAWGHVSNAVERVAASDAFVPGRDGQPSLEDMCVLVARLSTSPYPHPPTEARSSSIGWGNWDVRVYAAGALVYLAHRFSTERPDILDQFEAGLADPVASVRLQVAQNLHVVSVADVERMWRLGARIATTEADLEVVASYVNGSLPQFGTSDPDRCEALLAIVKDRLATESSDESVKVLDEVLGGWASELYVEDGRPLARQWLDEWSRDLVRYQSSLYQFISMQRGHLFARYNAGAGEEQRAMTDRAQQEIAQIVERASAAAAEDRATFISDADQSAKDAVVPRYRAASMLVNHAMNQFYFGSGAYSGPEGQKRELIGLITRDAKAQFLGDYAQILACLARSTEPNTLHHLLELYEFLMPADPVGVFDTIYGIVMTAGRDSGYHLEGQGSAAVVRMVKTYIADHRNVFDDDTRRDQLTALLRLFSGVGWPDAVRLLYELPELLR
jgi:hypothetical protein